MIRLKISNFIRKHKHKIKDLIKKLIIVAMGVFIATIILSSLSNIVDNKEEDNDIYNVYKPTQTIIKGQDISKEQFEKDSNLVNTFLDFCNEGKFEEAYNLISDECKEERYTTFNLFKETYCSIFDEKRECSLQAWISTDEYTVYQVRYANNMLATGTYDSTNVYQDYLTLNKKNNEEKISIGNFIDSEDKNIIVKTDEIEVRLTKKIIYLKYEEYEIEVCNKTDKTIALSDLKDGNQIMLKTSSGAEYKFMTTKFFTRDLILEPKMSKEILITFNKSAGSNNISETIKFSNIIRDYNTYTQNEEDYTDLIEIEIKVGD